MATPTKQYFVQLPGFEEGEVWDEGKFNRNKEQLYQDNPNAQVYETSAYLGGDVAEGDVFDVRLPGYEESERWDSAKLAKNREKLMADHPDVQITRMRPMRNWNPRGAQESLANIYARMDEINKQLAETPDDESSASDLRNMSDEDLVKAAANSQTTNAKTRRQLNRELEQLRAERDKNPMWQEYWEKTNSDIDASSKRIEQMRTNLDLDNPKSRRVSKFTGLTDRTGLGEMELRQDVKDNPEYYRDQEALLAAKTFYDEAKKIASAPSKYGDESGLANYWKGVTQNVGDALSVVALAKAMGNLPLIDAVQSIQAKEGKNVNIFDFSAKDMDGVDYLSNSQKEMVRAFVKRAEVESGRSDNLSRGYQAGKSAIESVGFMADFLVAGGAGDAAASKAVGKLVENTAENSLARLGAESLYGLVKSAVMTPLMPSTYANVLNGIAQLDENGGMDLSGKVILKAGADAFIETASETIGAKPLELLGLAAKVPADWLEKTTFGAWGRVLREGPVFGFMKQAGWNGFFEEMFEEVSGNAVRAWTGVDKDALKNFMQPEQLLITAASFAPMSIIGGAASTARYGYVKKKYGTSLEEIQSRLAELDFTPEQIAHITDIGRMNSPEAVAKALKPAADAMRTRGAFESDIKALMDYAYYASSMNVYDAFESQRVQQERDAKRDELSQIYGDFWKGSEKDGRTVQRVTLPDGKTGFVQDTDETGLMTVKWDDGSVGFTDAEHGAVVEESTLDSYLDSQILLDTQARDAAQMQEDAAVARQQFSNNIAQNADVPMGTPERQEMGKLALQTDPNTGATTPVRDANGNYVVVTMNGQVPVSENDLAAKWGISLQPKTQEQKDADAVAQYEATKKRVDAYNAIPQGSVVEANLEGLDEPVQYQFTHAVMNEDTGEVEIKVWDEENQREETLPESAFPDLAQAAAEVSAQRPAEQEPAPAEAPAETPQEDNTPRDFRGNPLPMKSDGRVDQGTLWSNDPEAWAAWNDQQRQDGGANSRAYIEGAKKDLEKDIKTLQKNYDAERDFDKRDAIEQQIAEKQQRLASLDTMLKGYETREKAAAEAAQAPVEETPAAPAEAPVAANEQPIVEAPVAEAQPSEEIGQLSAEEVAAEPQVEAQPAPQPVLSPAEQRRIKRLYNRAKEWADKTGQDVVICSTYEDIPESQTVARMYVRSGMPVYGWYDVSTEKVYVYLPDHADVKEIDKTFIHEVVSHRGLRGLLNDERHPDGYDRLCDRVWNDIMDEKQREKWMRYNFHLNVEDLRLDRMWNNMSEEDKARFNPEGGEPSTEFLRNLYENVLTEEERARVDAANQLYLQRAAADEYIAHLSETTDLEDSRSIWQKFIDLVKEFLEEHGIEVKMTDADLQTLLRASLARYEAMAAEGETQTDLANKGVASNSQESRFSVRYVPTPKQAKQIADDIHQQLGVSKAAAQRWVKSETSLAPIILDEHNSQFLDYIGDDRYAAIKKDSDYPQGTVDFNNICRKRLPFTRMYQRIQAAYPNTIITGEDLAKIRNIMKEHGITVACGLCYVEDRRQLLGEIATSFIGELNSNFENYASGGATKAKNADKFRALLGDDRKEDLSVYDLITLEGAGRLAQEHPGIYAAFQAFNNARGQQAGNLFQGYAEYKREILKWNKKKVASVNSHGGLRIFSYSDFEAHHLIDLVQIIQDCARKGVMIQGYTKVPAFARAVANTNIKLNRSLIPLGETGMVDGQLAYDPVEGIDVNDPDFLESNDNIGNILIGVNDEQIALAMLDPNIHFIIPYHSNQSGELRKLKQTGAWRNYKNEQTEKAMPGTDPKSVGHGINIYTDVLAAAEAEGKPITNERQFTEKFLEVCREKGLVPRFARLLPQDENGNYLYRPGYYKLLVDFKLFDENGRILPQKPVVAEFDDAFNKKILEDYVRGEEDALGDNLDDVYNEIVDALGLEKRNAQSGTPRSGEDALNDIYKSIDRANEIRTRRATLEGGLTTDGYSFGDKAVLDGYGLKAADLSRRDDVVTLHRLVAKKRNQGAGTQFMTDLTEMADKNDWVLALTPTKDLGASSVSRLKDFYKRFGFKENKGRNADLTVNESMIRQPEGSEIRFSIRGITGAQNADDQTALDNLAVATLMEDAGKDADTIWKATGWQKGADGKWREEIPDAKLKEGAELKKTQKAGDILDAPELFLSYPQLADMEVQLKKTASAGAYNEKDNKIVLDDEYNTDFVLSAEDQKRVNEQTMEYINGGTWKRRSDVAKYKNNLLEKAGKKVLSNEGIKSLLHELQHAIQHIEGFATGGNAAQMEKEYYDEAMKADAEKANFAWLFSRRNSVSRLRLVGRESMIRQMEKFDISKYTDRDKELFANLLNRLKNMPEEEFPKFVRGADAIAKNAKKAGELGYNNLAGEVEARNVERRSRLSEEGRRMAPPSTTEDVPRRDQIIRFRVGNESQRIFVSNAEKAVSDLKMDKATPEQWKKTLEKNGGLKAAEDKWLGLSDWLDGLDRKTVTKQEVLDFIAKNQIQIEETRYAEEVDDEYIAAIRSYNQELQDLAAQGESEDADENLEWAFEQMVERYGEDFEQAFELNGDHLSEITDWNGDLDPAAEHFIEQRRGVSDVRRASGVRLGYTTEGLQNKAEIALTVPTIEPWNETDNIHFGDAGEGRAIAWARFGDTFVSSAKDEAERKYREADKAFKDYRDEIVKKYALQATGTKTTRDLATPEENAKVKELQLEASRLYHEWQYGNHPREKVLVIDEIQSKRHQEAREQGGYKDDSALKKAEKKRDAAKAEYDKYHASLLEKYGDFNGIHDNITPEENAESQRLYREFRDAQNVVTRNGFDPMEDEEYRRLREEQQAHENNPEFKRLMDEWQRTFKESTEGENKEAAQGRLMEIDEQLKPLQERNQELLGAMEARERVLAQKFNETHKSRIPAAPFEKNWHELAMKRMLRYAAENGYEKVAWTTGEQQADRYNLANVIQALNVYPYGDGTYFIQTYSSDMTEQESFDNVPQEKLADYIGKELAVKVVNGENKDYDNYRKSDVHIFRGLDLKIGGEGMKGFYDDILPRFMNKYGKKWGVKVQDIYLPQLGDTATFSESGMRGLKMHSVDVTPEMKESVMQGQLMFRKAMEEDEKESKELFDAAKERFGTTTNLREAGYILPDGKLLDFSGRHMVSGDSSFLNGRRSVDHRNIADLNFERDGNTPTGRNVSMADFISRGAIRIDGESGSVNLAVKPTDAQFSVIRRIAERTGGEMYIDFGANDTEHYAEYDGARPDRVVNDIRRYFDEGYMPAGNTMFRRVTPEQDAEYMEAVNSGDMGKAQQMVDEAAEAAGYTIRGYHGTTHNFTIFDRRKGNAEGNWGKGFYFTNNLDDAEANYGNEDGPDLQVKIERLAENMEWMDGYEDMDFEERKAKAAEMLTGDDPHVISAALRMSNPVVFNSRAVGPKETFFDFDSGYNPETDEYDGEESGLLLDFINAWNDVMQDSEWDANNISPNEILDYADGDGITASQLEEKAREILDNNGIMDYNGDLASGEFLRQVFERMGFDGIVDANVNIKFGTQRRYGRSMDGMDTGTVHAIAFHPNQIKQTDPATRDDQGNVIPLSERFNPGNNDIRFRFSDNNVKFANNEDNADRAGTAQNENGDRENGPGNGRSDARQVEIANDRSRIRVLEAGVAPARPEYSSGLEGIAERREDQDTEAKRIIAAAKENGLFIEPGSYSNLPKLHLASRESVVYFDEDNGRVIKVKDPFAVEEMTENSPFAELYQHIIHNIFFPETRYTFLGVTTNHRGDEVRFVLSQDFVDSIGKADEKKVRNYLILHGLIPLDKYHFTNRNITVTDYFGQNSLEDKEGNIHVIDPMISFKRDPREIIDDFTSGTLMFRYSPEEAEESAIRFRKVEDPLKIAELEAGEKIPGYRTVVLNPDGSMASPMAGELGVAKAKKSEDRRVKTSSFTENAWNEAEENPDLADENGKIKLIKTDNAKRGLVDVDEVDYNPYNHLRLTPVNLQFKDAWKRPDLIYIKSEVPKSEAVDLRGIKDPAEKDRLSPYHAEKAVLPVGIHDWSGGGELLLSRWDKPVGQVAWEEIADAWANDEKVKEGVQFDRVPPQILDMLVERGIEILPPSKGKDKNEAYKAWKAGDQEAYEAWRDTGKAPKKNDGDTRFRTAYHGSIANFDAFDIKHAGSGEGFQAHGFGHYVSFDKDTATGYAWNNAFDYADRNGLIEPNVGDVLRNDSFDDYDSMVKRYDELLAKRKKEIADEIADEQKADPVDESMLNILQREQQALEKYAPLEEVFDGLRNIYTVEIPDDNGENYIDEMKTLAKPLRRRIADAIRAIPDERLDRTLHGPNWLPQGFKTLANVIEREQYAGLEIRRRMEDALGNTNEARKEVSRILHDAGFVGYTYEGRSDGPCAVIFSNDDIKVTNHVRFRTADDLVKRVQDYGLRGILDEDAAKAFWTDAFAAMPEGARREIVDKAFSSDADKQAIAERRYTREYIASLAKKGYTEDESGLLRYLADRLQAELGEELDENTLRYLIWRSANRYNSGIILNVAEDIALRRQLGVGEFSGDRFPSEAEQAVSEAENRIDSAEDEREASRRATRSAVRKTPYAALNAAMSGQRKYDQETVNSIVALAKDMIKKGDIDKVSAREMARLMTIIKDANGRRPATVKASALQLLDFMVDHTIGKEKELLDKMLKVRTAKVREPGVDTIAKLDLRTQNIINNFRDNYKLSEAEIDQAITELEDRMADGRRTEASLEDMRSQLEGLQLAKQYITEIYSKDADIRAVRQMMQASKEEFDGLTTEEKRQLRTARNEEIAADYEVIRSKKIEQVEAYRRLRGDLAKAINEGADRAQTFLEAEREREEQIHHWANADMQGVSADVRDRTLTGWAKFANSAFAKLFTAPLANLDQMLRTLGRKSPNGEGYLWKWMMGSVGKARNEEKLGLDAAEKKLNAKVREIFDEPGMSWNDIYAIERKMPKSKMSYFSANGEWVEEELTQGNLLYIYMVNKMSDGRMKLRQMNITEEDVERIKKNLDPRFVELADWIQEEFLPSLRDRYNETHKRLFGTSMASIENYFPLRILGGVIEEKRKVGDQAAKALPSDITGAIIKRTVNTKQLNLAGTDAFSLVVEHVREMEHWNAYAEASRDFSTLLKYKRFQNQIKQLNTVYGAGKDLLDLLWDTVNLSVGAYRPVTSPPDKNALKIAKGVTAAKISFRAYTAIKQILSWPAFLADANTFILAKNTSPHNWAKNWKWAMENLPNFKKRVESRQAGIDILKDATFNEETWLADVERWITQNGMFMNAFVDALTVSIGARSMYETKKARYLKEGFSEEQADEKAKFDAEVLFNETQQSSENEFMSTMQANRTVWNVMWTAYRNSSMGYQRQLHQGLRTIGRMARKGYKSESIEYMTKQLEREGLSTADAEKAAISRYERAGFQAAVRVAVFGWLVQFAWNLGSHAVYLLFGDDDDEKKSMFIEDATHALVGGAIEGLTMGNVISEALNMVKNGESLYNWDPTTLPIMSDVKSTISRMSSDPVAGLNDLVYLAVQIGLGTNPQTISDAIVAIYDACNGDVKMTKEAMICIMRILQVPQSQIDQFMIDEIGMKAKDARELSYEDIAKRYVDYKMNRNAPLTGPLYSDELRKKREKTLNTTFKKKYNERKKLKEEE